ncbi:MAG: DM13 domain-containing protein [Kordiimonas sp.]
MDGEGYTGHATIVCTVCMKGNLSVRFLKHIISVVIFSVSLTGLVATAADDGMYLNGPFNNAPMKTTGMWYLDERSDGIYFMLSEGFETTNGPNLQVYLSKQSASEVVASEKSTDLHIASLKSYKGGQTYKLPRSLNLKEYKSLAIVCDTFHKVWAAGDIHPDMKS